MNKKGFTLVELLAVIALLGVVMTIGLISIGSIRRKANDGMFADKLDFVIAGAKSWGQDNKNSLYIDSDRRISKSVGELIAGGYIDTDEKNASGDKALIYDNDKTSVNELKVDIYIKYNRIYACINKNNAKTTFSSIPWDNLSGDWFCS